MALGVVRVVELERIETAVVVEMVDLQDRNNSLRVVNLSLVSSSLCFLSPPSFPT